MRADSEVIEGLSCLMALRLCPCYLLTLQLCGRDVPGSERLRSLPEHAQLSRTGRDVGRTDGKLVETQHTRCLLGCPGPSCWQLP